MPIPHKLKIFVPSYLGDTFLLIKIFNIGHGLWRDKVDSLSETEPIASDVLPGEEGLNHLLGKMCSWFLSHTLCMTFASQLLYVTSSQNTNQRTSLGGHSLQNPFQGPYLPSFAHYPDFLLFHGNSVDHDLWLPLFKVNIYLLNSSRFEGEFWLFLKNLKTLCRGVNSKKSSPKHKTMSLRYHGILYSVGAVRSQSGVIVPPGDI